jgi:hypothetical protein
VFHLLLDPNQYYSRIPPRIPRSELRFFFYSNLRHRLRHLFKTATVTLAVNSVDRSLACFGHSFLCLTKVLNRIRSQSSPSFKCVLHTTFFCARQKMRVVSPLQSEKIGSITSELQILQSARATEPNPRPRNDTRHYGTHSTDIVPLCN